MRWSDEFARFRVPRAHAWLVLVASVAAMLACSKPSNPAAPTNPLSRYIGTWSGSITSETIGRGTATIVLDGGIAASTAVQVTGRWTFSFDESAFDASGTVSGGPLPGDSTLVLLFSPSLVPCPSAEGGRAEKGRAASLSVAGDRMQGSYIANGCPGGNLELARK